MQRLGDISWDRARHKLLRVRAVAVTPSMEATAAALPAGLSASQTGHMLGEFLHTSTSSLLLTNLKRQADAKVRGLWKASIHRNNWNIFKRRETWQYNTYNTKLQGVSLGQTLLFTAIIPNHWYLHCNWGSKSQMMKGKKRNMMTDHWTECHLIACCQALSRP